MKVLLINGVCGIRSTGRICTDIAEEFENQGHTVKIAYGREKTVPQEFQKYAVRLGSDMDIRLHAVKTRLFDAHGFGSSAATKKFLKWAEDYNPDLLWLHNIHGYYINIEQLFTWIKNRPDMEVRWTLHDCWAFTGHCSHFVTAGCSRWMSECHDCPLKKEYPASSFMDASRKNYQKKKALFTGVEHMTLITPSRWLAEQVKKSYLKDYPVRVEHTKIDTSIFRPVQSEIRKKLGLEDKMIILACSTMWTEKKGYYEFLKLADMISDQMHLVMVGLNQHQLKDMKPNMKGIVRTDSKQELAELYSAADVFVNLTHEDTYPTVNLEAEACGTRVITYDVGGCAETIHREDSVLVDEGNLEKVLDELKRQSTY